MKRNWHKTLLFDRKAFTRIFGLQMAWIAAALSVVAYPTHAFDYELAQSAQTQGNNPVVITTNSEYQFPLENTIGMSQGYHLLHAGVDLRASKGTAVVSMAEGTVVEVEEMRVGYGHYVRLAHKGTISTLYAHLDKVDVVPGQKVRMGQKIGTVGMTGWTTGPHLHFEVLNGNKTVNPMGYIGSK